MSERWHTLVDALQAFDKKIKNDRLIVGEIAAHIQHRFAAYIKAPDNRRVRVYKLTGEPTDLRSYIEELYPANAVEQSPTNQWQFGLGILVGHDQMPEFLLRWPLFITVSKDRILVEFLDKRTELARGPKEHDYEPLCSLMYDALLEYCLVSAGSIPGVKIGFMAS
jgi:hypothetical protein